MIKHNLRDNEGCNAGMLQQMAKSVHFGEWHQLPLNEAYRPSVYHNAILIMK